jgi:hypothetical protein
MPHAVRTPAAALVFAVIEYITEAFEAGIGRLRHIREAG